MPKIVFIAAVIALGLALSSFNSLPGKRPAEEPARSSVSPWELTLKSPALAAAEQPDAH